MTSRTVAQVSGILVAGLIGAYGLSVWLDPQRSDSSFTSTHDRVPGVERQATGPAPFVPGNAPPAPARFPTAPPLLPPPPQPATPGHPATSSTAQLPEPTEPDTTPPFEDPLDAFRQPPPPPAGGTAGPGAPVPTPPTFDPQDFQRPDIIQHLRTGNLAAIESIRIPVLLYLSSMNEFFMRSAIFDDGSCTALADPRLGVVAALALQEALGFWSPGGPDLGAFFDILGTWLGERLQEAERNPGEAVKNTVLTLAELDVLKRQGEMDGTLLAVKYQCSSAWVRRVWANARRFVQG